MWANAGGEFECTWRVYPFLLMEGINGGNYCHLGVSSGHLVGMSICLLSLTSNFDVVQSTSPWAHLEHGGPL